jgi:Domain of Unknown Function (DUF1080)
MNQAHAQLASLLMTVAAIVFGTTVCLAEEKADSDGWISLFDGQTLKGWKVSEHPEQWKVEDGKIVAAGPRSHLFYMGDDESKPAEFKDFDFKADVMTAPGSNSGIYFHTRYQAVGFPQIGFEAQVNNSHGDPVKTGSIYHIVKNYVPPAKDNEWFTEEIIVKGNNIKTLVNGKIICDYTEPPGVKGPMEKVDKGTFAFQAHDPKSTTYYKNIKVKRLK